MSLFARLYRGETTFNFIGRRWIGFGFSLFLVVVTIVSLFARGLNLGIDFKGGVAWEVPAATLTIDDVTKVLELGYASDQTYQSVISGESQLGETSTTDGTLESQGLVVLEDNKEIQPAQNLVPAISSDFLAEHPDVADVLNPLMAALTTENLTEMNGEMAVDRAKPEDVAKEFLT